MKVDSKVAKKPRRADKALKGRDRTIQAHTRSATQRNQRKRDVRSGKTKG